MKRELPEQEEGASNSFNKKTYLIIGSILIVLTIALAYYYYNHSQQKGILEVAAADSVAVGTVIPDNVDPRDTEDADGWSSLEEYNYWNNAIFTLSEYDAIPLRYRRGITKIFIHNNYLKPKEDNIVYKFTRIKDRAKSVFCYGNFTDRKDADDWNKEMAFLIEKNDYQSSAIWIVSAKGDILFWKQFTDELPLINSFKKGAKIFLNQQQLEPSPSDGIIIKNKNSKYALLYNKESKTFDSYYQYNDDELTPAVQEKTSPYLEELEDVTIDSTAKP